MENALIAVVSTILVYVSAVFFVSRIVRKNDIADIAWGPGIALAGWAAYVVSEQTSLFALILLSLATLWATRLGFRILRKNLKKRVEDPRYVALAREWGVLEPVYSFIFVFLLQGVLMLPLAAPLILASLQGGVLNAWFFVGIALWCVGFFFEVIGDYQLDSFVAKPENKGKVMRTGLWYYSRHPNYFGEVTMWWGIALSVLTLPYGWLGLLSPLTITYLIVFVSGIPMLEKLFADNPEFQGYRKTTSALIPFPPRK